MVANRFNIRNRIPNLKRACLIDTNVLLDYFAEDKFGYSHLIDSAQENNRDLYITTLTISEYINRKCRKAFDLYKEELYQREDEGEMIAEVKFDYKKGFRITSDFKKVYNHAMFEVNNLILPIFELIDADDVVRNSIDYDNPMLDDFNDLVYQNLALKNNWAIVTHDRDLADIQTNSLIIYTTLN